jgi:hypothetical protein
MATKESVLVGRLVAWPTLASLKFSPNQKVRIDEYQGIQLKNLVKIRIRNCPQLCKQMADKTSHDPVLCF